jgi:hypothetical protein
LRGHLSAEHALSILVGAQSPEQVDLECFELEQREQLVERVTRVVFS